MNEEVRFLTHEPCSECGSKDNLGVWSDGHKWCFGCGYYVPPEGKTVEYVRTLLSKKTVKNASVQLPVDASMSVPLEPRTWLASYGIDPHIIATKDIRWSEKEKCLLFQVREQGKLIFYQKRFFGRDDAPKYMSVGDIGSYLNVMQSSISARVAESTVVVVEDFISASKVSLRCDSLPLFGSHIPKQLAVRLSNVYDNMIIWLDNDKATQAMKFKHEFEALFTKCRVIITPKDPKEFSFEEIGQKIKYAVSSH